jgi:predicted dehydrogenase
MHAEWIRRALESGKHVLCEKPLTLGEADTRDAFAVATACGRILVEAYMWPHHPRAQRILSLVADGELGTLVSHVAAFTFPLADQSNHRVDERGAGAAFDVGIYCLSPALLMTGVEPGAVAAHAVRNERGIDTSMSGLVELGNVAATFHVSFTAPDRRYQYVSGTEGWFALDDHVPGPEAPGTIEIHRADGSLDRVDHDGANAFERMISNFIDVCAGQISPPWGAVESIRLARLLDRLHDASR